ncbi:MAG: flagellar filament capping protein FliD [Burkholderiaceae bacterium]|jgi:flagellar capping protein FliD
MATSAINGSDLLTKLGAGSGTNTKTLAESLVEVERKPRADALNARITKSENRISGLSAAMLNLDTIKKAFQTLDDPSDFNALNIDNSNSAAFTAKAVGVASTGNHSVEVLALASAQRNSSAGFAAASDPLNGGRAFSLQLALNGGTPSTIRVPAANSTPAGMVSAINSAKLGVTAQLVNTNDGSAKPFKIIVTGSSGASNQFTLTSDDGTGIGEQQNLTFGPATASGKIVVAGVEVDVAAGDSAYIVAGKVKLAMDANSFITANPGRSTTVNNDGSLSINFAASDGDVAAPSWGDTGGTGVTANYVTSRNFAAGATVTGVSFGTRLANAADAELRVNGLTLKRSSNTVTDAIPGLTLNLQGTTPSAATLALSRDPSKLKEKVQALVKSYNDTMSDFAILSGPKNKKDETDVYSGSLQNDSTLSNLKIQLRSLFTGNSSTPGGSVQALRDLGVSIQKDGTLAIDEKKLDSALADNYTEIVTMMTADRENKSNFGVSKRGLAGDAVKRLNDLMGTSGLLMSQTESSQRQIKRYETDLANLEKRMEILLARYTQQFSIMDDIVGNSNSMRTYLKNQFAAMSGTNSG